MSPKERILAALALKPVDCVPVFPRDLTLGMDVKSYPTPEVCNDKGNYNTQKSAESVLALQEYARHDAVVGSIHDIALEVDLFGGEANFPDFEAPSVVRAPIQTKDDLKTARALSDKFAGRWDGYTNAYRAVSDAIGDTIAIAANIEGPITKTCVMRTMGAFSYDVYDDPKFAADLIDFSTELIILRMRALADAGAHFVFLASSCDDPGVLGPDNFRKYSVDVLHRIVREADQRGLPVVYHPHGLFTCGKYVPLVREIIDTGISAFQFAEGNDLATAKQMWGDEICIMGGLDVLEVMLPGPDETIREKTNTLLNSLDTRGFILTASCSLHRGLQLSHLRAMVDAAHSHRK